MHTIRHCTVRLASTALVVLAGLALVGQGGSDNKGRPIRELTQKELQQILQRSAGRDEAVVKCANLIYAGKQSRCFSDNFLRVVEKETNIETAKAFEPAKLHSDTIFDYPFAVMHGEGAFSLREQERVNLRAYLLRGGFLLASAGCSSQDWNQSFRREIKRVFPEYEMKKIPMEHPIFGMVFNIPTLRLKKSKGTAMLEGLEIDGRLVMVYSPEGLNDTGNAGKGCCCCGGNEIQNSEEVNTNVMAYALTH
jgi:hypothetical protein